VVLGVPYQSRDAASGVIRRHPVFEQGLQRAIRAAAGPARIAEPGSCFEPVDGIAINAYADEPPTEEVMASITIRNLDDSLKRALRIRAAEHGRSMEEEAREILRQAIGKAPANRNLGEAIHRRFAALGGADLELPPREAMPEPTRFE
jgi:antitoxin FitA